jgi:hypothetical protein
MFTSYMIFIMYYVTYMYYSMHIVRDGTQGLVPVMYILYHSVHPQPLRYIFSPLAMGKEILHWRCYSPVSQGQSR